MSISGNTTPSSEGFSGFTEASDFSEYIHMNRSTPTPIKRIKSCLNKISERNFPKISDEMLTIHLLDEPENEEVSSLDKETMLPMVETFMSNVCVFERNVEAMGIYTKAFCKIKDNWKGRQGRVLMEVMISELGKFFTEYNKSIDLESEEKNEVQELRELRSKKRNHCLKLSQFVAMLYNEGGVSIRLVLVILQMYLKNKKDHIEIFCKLLSGCQTKLMKDETFRSKVFDKYKAFLTENSKSKDIEPMYRFMCLEVLEKF
jgi:hypothetical protein